MYSLKANSKVENRWFIVRLAYKVGVIRRFCLFMERVPPFVQAALFEPTGIWSPEGRQLIWGKFRRITLNMFPPVARYLQKRYGMEGGCHSCGASCNLLFRCPHWDERSHLCRVYSDRPSICRTFPITPADISDRNLSLKSSPCGFKFQGQEKQVRVKKKLRKDGSKDRSSKKQSRI